MGYLVRRRPHPFWRFYELGERIGTPLALQELLGQLEGSEVRTSCVGLAHIQRYLGGLGFGHEHAPDWPIELSPRASRVR